MMGHPLEAGGMMADNYQQYQKPQKATFSGLTAMVGVIALIADIISVSVPHWGMYQPVGQSYYAAGNIAQDSSGHFGPFQSCKYTAYYSYCGEWPHYQGTTWLTGAGICAIISVISLGVFCLFAVLHVAMQLQRREIMVKFSTAVFVKVVSSSIAVVGCIGSVVLGGVHFAVGGRHSALSLTMGIMYYIQIILIFVTILLVILSTLSWRKAKKNPMNLVPRNHASGVSYEVRNDSGVSMTQASGAPYVGSFNHGQPRLPNHPQPQTPKFMHTNYIQQIQPSQNGSYVNNGFTSVALSVPPSTQQPMPQQPMPMQPIKPIQPVQGVPQTPASPVISNSPNQNIPMAGVNFTPGGKTGTGGVGYSVQMNSGAGGYMGSMESLNSTNSSTLSNISYGSTISTGSGHGPLRSSLKKPKNKDKASISSESSSKRVRLSLGAEQTSV